MKPRDTTLWECVKRLPTDYSDYGGTVKRWADKHKIYGDCGKLCRHYWSTDGNWGVCANPTGPRRGLLTYKHQAGDGCFARADDHK